MLPAQIGEDIVPRDRLLARAEAVHTPDCPVGPGIGNIGLHILDARPFDPGGVECLLVLAPADIADKALIVEIDTLPPNRHNRSRQPAILELQPVELDVFGVTDKREDALAIQAVIVVLQHGERGLALGEQGEIALLRLEPGTDSRCDRMGIPCEASLIDRFKT
jgi:hypothetical protein